MTGFPRSAHARYDRDRAPSVPRDQRCSTLTGRCPRPAARRITTATVLCPGASTVIYPGLHRHEASVKGSRRSPARPSPHLWPPDDSGALGLFPGLRTHADRTRARTPGRGQAQSTSLEPRLRHLRHAGPPICEFTRTCATSCRITGRSCAATPTPAPRTAPRARGRPDRARPAPRCRDGQGRVHRRLDQRPPPQRDRLRPLAAGGGLTVRCCHVLPPRGCPERPERPGFPDHGRPGHGHEGQNGVHREQGRVEPDGRHRRGQPQAPGQVRGHLMGRHRGQRREPAPQPRGHRLQHRQAVPGRRARRHQRPGHRVRQRQHPVSACRSAPARPANRDRHDRAVDAGTCHRLPSRPASHGRAAARPAAAAAAASISTVMITAAPYRRRDHKSAGSSTCVRPQRRHLPRRGRNSSGPASIATTRRRAQPHRASTAPQHGDRSRPAASRASTLPAEPRTVITVVPPPAPFRRPSPEPRQKERGGPLPSPTWPR